MKVVILAGGLGTRISEESHIKPKPMIEIGSSPILWHILKIYSHFGFNDFIICLGYKGHLIKEYFSNYYIRHSDVTFDFSKNNSLTIHQNVSEPFKVTLVDTGINTMTGGRIKRVEKYIGNSPFMLTYGDGVSNININSLLKFHNKNNTIVTLTAVKPKPRFGVLQIDDNFKVTGFKEKSIEDSGWINGGFMVVKPDIFSFIKDDSTIFEKDVLENDLSILDTDINLDDDNNFVQIQEFLKKFQGDSFEEVVRRWNQEN